MEKRSQDIDEATSKSVDMGKLPLRKVAAEYFGWKEASSSTNTVARERALFKTVASFFGATFAVGQIRLHHIRDYQRERKLQASRTRKQPISGRSVNYEMHLLRSVMNRNRSPPMVRRDMRGDDQQQNHIFSYLSPEARVQKDYPLRAIQAMMDEVLKQLSRRFDSMYARVGRPSIAPEKLLRAQLLQMLYSIRSERLQMKEMDYSFAVSLFRGAKCR
jgi:hypothetical protein